MRIGAIVPNAGPLPGQLGVAQMAQAAEAAGAASLWVSDHLVLSKDSLADYPYTKDGDITWDASGDYFEALSMCAYIAAVTDACEVGTAILILPQRNVLQTAKEASTIDALSRGRLVLGVAAGWNRLEMESLGYSFDSRGKRMDEMIGVLRECWTGQPRGFEGDHIRIPDDLLLYPRPLRPGGPPILIGGMTSAAVKRAAHVGDGWLALAFVDRWDSEALARAAQLMRTQTDEAGRDIAPRWALKLHCPPDMVGRLPAHIEEAAGLGFEEVILEAPFTLGIEAAGVVISEAVATWS